MSLARRQVGKIRLKLPDSERIEMIANEMLLLRLFPKHEQAKEFRRNIQVFAAMLPALHAAAEILVREKMAGEDCLIECPEGCARCHGAGTFSYDGRPRFCGCPAGEKLIANRATLPEVAPAIAAPVLQMPRRHELESVRSLFDVLREG